MLFGGLEPAAPVFPRAREHADLAKALPANLWMGTSSWAFPGWEGLVYAKEGKRAAATTLSHEGLAAYARSPLLRAVGLDRTFYQPIAEREFARYAAQVPAEFRFLVKAHGQLFRPPGLGRVGEDFSSNPPTRDVFLESGWMLDAVVAPAVQGLASASGEQTSKLGVVLMQLPPLPLGSRGPAGTAQEFATQLIAFLGRVRGGAPQVPLALEVRNSALLRSDVAEALAALRIAPALVHHPSMPRIAKQREAWGVAMESAQTTWVCRWMLHHAQSYEGAKGLYEPFDRIVDDDAVTRAEIAEAGAAALRRGQRGIVIVNNKAEGSAPLSIEGLAQQFARVFAE
jgi:uncharacterized protein YecE (DUF72 family)